MTAWTRITQGLPGRGLLISAALHGAAVLVLLVTMDPTQPESAAEPPAVEVTLVEPPPPVPQAEAPQPPDPAAEPDPEPTAEPPAAPPELAVAEPGPEPGATAAEPAEPEPAPAPEPQPAAAPPVEPESPETEVPEPEVPEPEAPAPEAPEPPAEPEAAEPEVLEPEEPGGAGPSDAEAAPIPVLRPVVRFGEEDSGPRLSPDGNAAEDPADEAPDAPGEPPADTAAAMPDPAAEPAGAEADTPEAGTEPAPTLALPEISLPEAALAGSPQSLVEAAESTRLQPAPAEPPPATETAPPEPAPNAAASTLPDAQAEPLAAAKRLFSTRISGDALAMTAAGTLPREVRASELCTTELREQLRHAGRRPELLPAYRLASGNVLEVRDAAFRAEGSWYALQFRCTVDDAAMQVEGFALTVGAAIPRAQWKARGFPDF
ncbi:uncharacterized protein DUF930 [Hoeflea marina]|uniref:Uncharacterized protein DUF930 n=1 Tax=Hoeflea marina TaxID=274592 RepID=A0A317PI28_9HYPH|nr:DUF930 domain-containing protein [Hoeflea marina]PWV97683.1 uncharacterized protein DUF930 [Hoeflea marina]